MRDTAAALQRELVAHLRASGALTEPAVAEALLSVPRHHFLPNLSLVEVYADEAIPTKHADGRPISSSSQPTIMAIMLEQLAVAPGQRILEIGAGTGYNAALLGQLVGPSGEVIAVDLDDDLVQAAREHLSAAAADNVQVVQTDGAFGHAPGAPYDRIILTVSAWDLAPAWHAQLKSGGRLVLPLEVGPGPQLSIALVKPSDRQAEMWFESVSARECGFMRLRGAYARPEHWLELGPQSGISLVTTNPPPATAEAIYGWLTTGSIQTNSGMRLTVPELFGGLGLWLGLNGLEMASMTMPEELAGRLDLPCLVVFTKKPASCLSMGLLGREGLCLFRRPSPLPTSHDAASGESRFELLIQAYGPGGPALAQQLLGHLDAWQAVGRPGTEGLRVRAFAREHNYAPAPGEIVVAKHWSQLVLDWPAAN